VLDLPIPGEGMIKDLLLNVTHKLSVANTKYIRSQKELSLRVELMEDLTNIFPRIMKSVDAKCQVSSILEALLEGFDVEATFMLIPESDHFAGFAVKLDPGMEPQVSNITVEQDKISGVLGKVVQRRSSLRVGNVDRNRDLHVLLGAVKQAWLVPVYKKNTLLAIIGLGFQDEQSVKFNAKDFGKVLDLLGSEIGLSLSLSQHVKRFKQEARIDDLTGLLNRGAILKIVDSEFQRFLRNGIPLSIALIDVDNFKSLNDGRGHLAGDEFLETIAGLLDETMRVTDYLGRYGGDEFITVFPNTLSQDVGGIMERAKKKIGDYCTFIHGSDLGKSLSISIGIAEAKPGMKDYQEVFNRADRALYKAKRAGRNCIRKAGKFVRV